MKKLAVGDLTLGAISAALGTVFLVAGCVLPYGQLVLYLISPLPLTMLLRGGSRGRWAYLLSFVVTGSAALLMTGFNYIALVPYAALFGWYPLLADITQRMTRRAAMVVRFVAFECGALLIWRFTELLTFDTDRIGGYIFPLMAVGSVAAFFLCDAFVRRAMILTASLSQRMVKQTGARRR